MAENAERPTVEGLEGRVVEGSTVPTYEGVDHRVPEAKWAWRGLGTTITIHDFGPKCYKQYRRGDKMFWRNYKRAVPGGLSFVERFGVNAEITRRAMADTLARQLFTPSNVGRAR